MIKIGRFFRESVERKITEGFKTSESFFLLQYSGLSSPQMTLLRSRLDEAGSRLFVTKNSLMRRVLKGANLEGLDDFINGPTAIVFAPVDISIISKALIKFSKENTNLNLKGAFFKNRILDKADIEAISNLPSKEMLRAQVVFTLKSPISNLVFILKGNLNKLVTALNQIKEKMATAETQNRGNAEPTK